MLAPFSVSSISLPRPSVFVPFLHLSRETGLIDLRIFLSFHYFSIFCL